MGIVDYITAKLGEVEDCVVLKAEIILVGSYKAIAENGLARPLTRQPWEAGGGEATDNNMYYRDLPLSSCHREEALCVCVCVEGKCIYIWKQDYDRDRI